MAPRGAFFLLAAVLICPPVRGDDKGNKSIPTEVTQNEGIEKLADEINDRDKAKPGSDKIDPAVVRNTLKKPEHYDNLVQTVKEKKAALAGLGFGEGGIVPGADKVENQTPRSSSLNPLNGTPSDGVVVTPPVPNSGTQFSDPGIYQPSSNGLPDSVIEIAAAQLPESPVVQKDYGDLLYRRGDYSSALGAYGKSIELGAKDTHTFTAHASAAEKLGMKELAHESAGKALAADAANPIAKSIHALTSDFVSGGAPKPGAGFPPEPSPGLDAGDGKLPFVAGLPGAAPPESGLGRPADFVRLAQRSIELGDLPLAEKQASEAVRRDPTDAAALATRALALNRGGKANEALADAEKAVELAPQSPSGYAMRSWARNRLRRHEEALADAERALAGSPGSMLAALLKAYAQAGLGRREAAFDTLGRLAAAKPELRPRLAQASGMDSASLMRFVEEDLLGSLFPAAAPAPAPSGRGLPTAVIASAFVGGGLAVGSLILFLAAGRRKAKSEEAEAEPGEERYGPFTRQYEILREVGRGGMGVVYEARDLGLERRVAVKKMRGELQSTERDRQRFVEEARTVAKLKHPNIIEIYSVLEEAGEIYLVFEFCDGKPVSALLRETERLAFAEAKRILGEACDAVDYAHRHGVVHRDLKPSNIMLTEDDEVKVMDFGIARRAQGAVAAATRTATPAGTPAYMAPEQEGGEAGPRTDVFALGVCLYEMVTGRLPFAGQAAGMMLNKARGRILPLNGQAGLPAGLEPLLAKALDPDPGGRFATPGELRRAVDALRF